MPQADNLSEEEFKRLMEVASQLQSQKSGSYSLQEIKETAEQLGISEEAVKKALNLMQTEKQQQKQRKSLITTLIGFAIIAALLITIIYYANKKPEFKAQVTTIITTKPVIKPDEVEDLPSIKLFKDKKINVAFLIKGLKSEYPAKCEFYNPKGQIIETTERIISHKNQPKAEPKIENFEASLPLTAPTGKWKVKLIIQNKTIAEREVFIEYGAIALDFCSQVAKKDKSTDYYRLDNIQQFSRKKHTYMYAFITMPLFYRTTNIEFKWYTQGKIFRNYILENTPSRDLFWAYHRLETASAPLGKWNVEVLIGGVKVVEGTCELTE